jgi:hypothetical protein
MSNRYTRSKKKAQRAYFITLTPKAYKEFRKKHPLRKKADA